MFCQGQSLGILLKEAKHCHVLRTTEDAPMHPPHPPASPSHSLLPVYEKCYLPSPSTVRKDSQVPKLQRLRTKRIILNPVVNVEEMKDTKLRGIISHGPRGFHSFDPAVQHPRPELSAHRALKIQHVMSRRVFAGILLRRSLDNGMASLLQRPFLPVSLFMGE